jgi:hypothetical protein
MKSEEASSGDARQKVFMGVEARAACGSHKGTEHKGSRDEPRVFTAPEGHCPWSHTTRHVCAVVRTKAEAFGGVRRPAGKQAVQQARRKPAGEHSRRLAPKEHSRRRAEGTFGNRTSRSFVRQGLHKRYFERIFTGTRSSKKIFKEALQRSSSEKLFTNKDREQKINMVFIAEHGSAIEGGCCDTNRTVHARG